MEQIEYDALEEDESYVPFWQCKQYAARHTPEKAKDDIKVHKLAEDSDAGEVKIEEEESDVSWEMEELQISSQDLPKKISHSARVHTLNLRRNLNQLENIWKEKILINEKIRGELKACRLRIEKLEKERDSVAEEIKAEEEAGNIAAVFRLHGTYRRVVTELHNEEDIESTITLMQQENEYELWQVDTEQVKFEGLRDQVQKEEGEYNKQRIEQAEQRVQKEQLAILQAQHRHKRELHKEVEDLEERELRHRKAVEAAQKNHEKAVQFLKETMSRVHQKEAEEEVKTRENMEKRMQAILSLKNSIAANRENLRVRQAQNKVKAAEAKKQEMREKEAVLAEGGNVIQHLYHQKRLQEFEKQKHDLEEQQKLRKVEIVRRILQEEAYMKKQKKQISNDTSKSLDETQRVSKPRSKALQYVEEAFREKPDLESKPKKWRSPSLDEGSLFGDLSTELREERTHEKKMEEDEEEQNMFDQPEFTGLWEQGYEQYEEITSEFDSKPVGGTKMEKEILAATLDKLRNGIIQKQVAAGHEFKGCPFYSKPSVIHFKDFEVGKAYKKRVILTNASYGINYCRLMGISEDLKDFVRIHFNPPGQLCTGMSCEMMVTFKPMINEDLKGEVMLSAQTGRFSIPLKCTIKKCSLAVDKEFIDFGTHVIGETILRTITLTNQGALGTKFQLQTPTDVEAMRLTTAKSSPGRVASFDSIGAISEDTTRCSSVVPRASRKMEMKTDSRTTENLGPVEPSSSEAGIETENVKELESPPGEKTVEIKLGEVTKGEIGPSSTVKLQIIFTPLIPGEVEAEFEITFDNPDCKSIHLRARGAALDLPVWVSKPNIDLRICMYDRLYQDSIVFQNRGKTALHLKFEVCKELKLHMDVLPKIGYINAQASFSIQLKFLPRQSLPEDAGKYFDKETGVLEAPLTVLIVGQTKPIQVTVHAIVTSSNLEITPAEVDFGYCTIYEVVTSTIQITNRSILPQEFGFVGIPEFIEVQPNDGFGTLLPLESLQMDIIFKAQKAKEYKMDLTCKTAINRQFKVSCKAIGVHPPLALSHSLIRFAATALNDMSTAILYVINSHTSRNYFAYDVPRIGKGDVAPVGPTFFEFLIPEGSPIDIMPSVGSVLPGEKCLVRVCFRPTLSEQSIKEEAVRIQQKTLEARAVPRKESIKETEVPSKKEKREPKSEKKSAKKSPGRTSPKSTGHTSPPKHSVKANKSDIFTACLLKPDDIKPDSDVYFAAQTASFQRFSGQFERHIVPCFVASSAVSTDPKKSTKLNYSPYNTLYLELCCPSVAPPIIIISDNGRNNISFGEVAVGQRVLKKVEIQNISQAPLEVGFSILSPLGPFVLLNAVGILEPGNSAPLLISFSPQESKRFYENLEVRSSKAVLRLNITGQGLAPSVVCSVQDGVINMGYVLSNDSVTTTFKLQNVSAVALQYSIKLDSLSVTRHEEQQKRPPFLGSGREASSLVGTQNFSGLSVFSVSPVEGILDPGITQDFTVTFSPDHESLYYSDCLRVELFNKEIAHVIHLKGASRNHMMFVEGGDPLDVSVESLSITPTYEDSTKDQEETAKLVLLKLQCVQTQNTITPAVREIYIGSVRTSQTSGRKSVEFTLENLPLLNHNGFSAEPVKGMVEPGQRKAISVSWVPPAGFDLKYPATATAQLTVKGDIIEKYKIICSALVISS
ncbi:cilia- and flagella-associated protein 74 isoform X2 [Microcaecilia unicolor]|uniref:Cilia- and flagella-associated protein 74 isoform X2 n=1 Tax=Microcaecilia unicolor TaxID=1415580 RepID=A0A6P7WUL2_9AMPH|nr:cilia- and flagella-associated protein 74 isoform X2 [Microcaecilia unicolor]